jgi:hypothetical protein
LSFNMTSQIAADREEAWGIAFDLIADLGAGEALAWAEDYLTGLRSEGQRAGMDRWSLVTDALAQLAIGPVH